MFEKIVQRARGIKTGRILQDAVQEVVTEIESKNRERLFAGKRKDNSRTAPRYAKSTKAYKARKGQPTNRVTLKDAGDFHESIRAEATQRELVVGSDHNVNGFGLADWLEERYSGGSSIYGIPFNDLKKLILPGVVKGTRRELQG